MNALRRRDRQPEVRKNIPGKRRNLFGGKISCVNHRKVGGGVLLSRVRAQPKSRKKEMDEKENKK